MKDGIYKRILAFGRRYRTAKLIAEVDRGRRREAIRIAKTLPVPPDTVEDLLKRGMNEADITRYVNDCFRYGREP